MFMGRVLENDELFVYSSLLYVCIFKPILKCAHAVQNNHFVKAGPSFIQQSVRGMMLCMECGTLMSFWETLRLTLV